MTSNCLTPMALWKPCSGSSFLRPRNRMGKGPMAGRDVSGRMGYNTFRWCRSVQSPKSRGAEKHNDGKAHHLFGHPGGQENHRRCQCLPQRRAAEAASGSGPSAVLDATRGRVSVLVTVGLGCAFQNKNGTAKRSTATAGEVKASGWNGGFSVKVPLRKTLVDFPRHCVASEIPADTGQWCRSARPRGIVYW